MTRLPFLRPDDLDAEQRALYDEISSGPRSRGPQHFALTRPDGSLTGPFNALLHAPPVGRALQGLGAAVRYGTALPDRTRELAILAVAAHWDCAFERAAHESVGAAAGLTEAELTAVREGRVPELVDDHERACAHLVRALLAGDVDDATWQRHARTVSGATLVELTTLVGYYATLALQLRVFRVDDAESP